MKEGAKLLAAAAAAVLLVQIHRKEKERLALGWDGYGAHILGLEAGGPGFGFAGPGQVRVYDEAGGFYGIYEYQTERGRFQPVKMFLGD